MSPHQPSRFGEIQSENHPLFTEKEEFGMVGGSLRKYENIYSGSC